MSTGDNRSLGSGISFPQWMKNKNSRFELDPSAFSPTELDDTFMLYYRKPKIETNNTETTIIAANLPENITVATVTKKKADFSQHPISCQKYLPNGPDVTSAPRQSNVEMKIKSPGTDDGFKGEAAKCGSSIIKVASQMISNQGLGLRTCEQEMVKYDGRRRRNSKSLPASPLTSPGGSPKVNRKVNKYFTGAFTDVDKSKGSWILSNLLAKRDLSQSVGHIKEELQEDLERASSTASISESKTPPAFRAKPSELREMNFWSPTSM